MTTSFRKFTCAREAQEFGLALRTQGLEPLVRVIPATAEETAEVPDPTAAEAEIARFGEAGEELGPRALAWAKASYWYRRGGDLGAAVDCLASDLDDGACNGAASRAQAALYLKRLRAALSRAPKIRRVVSPATPPAWEIYWTPAPETQGYGYSAPTGDPLRDARTWAAEAYAAGDAISDD